MDSSVSLKDEFLFLRVCHHISTGLYLAYSTFTSRWFSLFVYKINYGFLRAVFTPHTIHSTVWLKILYSISVNEIEKHYGTNYNIIHPLILNQQREYFLKAGVRSAPLQGKTKVQKEHKGSLLLRAIQTCSRDVESSVTRQTVTDYDNTNKQL